MNKVQMAYEVLLMMKYLGYENKEFLKLKSEQGSLENLHTFLENQIYN
jgi:hypothetical protein